MPDSLNNDPFATKGNLFTLNSYTPIQGISIIETSSSVGSKYSSKKGINNQQSTKTP